MKQLRKKEKRKEELKYEHLWFISVDFFDCIYISHEKSNFLARWLRNFIIYYDLSSSEEWNVMLSSHFPGKKRLSSMLQWRTIRRSQEHLVNHTLEAHIRDDTVRGIWPSVCFMLLQLVMSLLDCFVHPLYYQVMAWRESLTILLFNFERTATILTFLWGN